MGNPIIRGCLFKPLDGNPWHGHLARATKND